MPPSPEQHTPSSTTCAHKPVSGTLCLVELYISLQTAQIEAGAAAAGLCPHPLSSTCPVASPVRINLSAARCAWVHSTSHCRLHNRSRGCSCRSVPPSPEQHTPSSTTCAHKPVSGTLCLVELYISLQTAQIEAGAAAAGLCPPPLSSTRPAAPPVHINLSVARCAWLNSTSHCRLHR